MSQEFETTSYPDKGALATVLSYLRNKNLKDTEEALKRELAGLGQHHQSVQPLQVAHLGQSGTEPSKYEESYSSQIMPTTSASTMADFQPASTKGVIDTTHHKRSFSTGTTQEERDTEPNSYTKKDHGNHLDSENLTKENSSGTPSINLCKDVHPVAWPKILQAESVKPRQPRLSPTLPLISRPRSMTSPTSSFDKSPLLIPTSLTRSISDPGNDSPSRDSAEESNPLAAHSTPAVPQFPLGSPLLFQLAAGQAFGALRPQILTPVLTVLPQSSLFNPLTTSAIQSGGQPLVFSASSVQSTQPQVLTLPHHTPVKQSEDLQRSGQLLTIQSPTANRVYPEPTTGQTLSSPIEHLSMSSASLSPPRTLASLMLSEVTPQYLELKAFAEEFKTKRIRLGYTQGAVGQSLADKGYSQFAQSTISRFEQMQLSPTNAAAIKQILEKWLHDTECPNSQSSNSVSSSTSKVSYIASRKRKKRAVFTSQTKISLDEFFKQNPRPNRQLIENISNELDLLPEEVRVWFCNKRQKSKPSLSDPQSVFHYSYERESSSSRTPSFVDSPPSRYEATAKEDSPLSKTPFTIEELSKSSACTTMSPAQSTCSIILDPLSSMRHSFLTT